MKIDDKAVIPLGWVLSGFGSVIMVTIFGVFWVASVNYRLQRIEEKLGIPPLKSESSSVQKSFASEIIPEKVKNAVTQ